MFYKVEEVLSYLGKVNPTQEYLVSKYCPKSQSHIDHYELEELKNFMSPTSIRDMQVHITGLIPEAQPSA